MYRKVLCEDEDQTAIDSTATGYDAVTGELLLLHTEVVATMLLEHVVLFERAWVEQHVDTFACSVLAALVLLLYGFLTTTETGLFALLDELLDFV